MATHGTLVGTIDDEILSFTTGRDLVLDRGLIVPDCIGTAAHVTMLSKLRGKGRVFNERDRKKIVAALVGIIDNAAQGSMTIGKGDQDVHLAIERVLTEKLGGLGKKVHTARSRNDQIAVDLRIYAKEHLQDLMEEVVGLSKALLKFAGRHARVPMVGRTHMQPAMPSTVGLWASAQAESLVDDLGLLQAAFDLNDRCPLGSAAGYGVSFGTDRALTAKLLGFQSAHDNVLYASNARGKCESAILSAASQCMLTVSRLAQDMILYSMPEFAYFSLPESLCTGSSIMPQKKNPDAAELMRSRASTVLFNSALVADIVKSLPSGYSRDLQDTKGPFMDGLSTTRACVRIMRLLVGALKVDRDALLKGFSPEVFATDRALDLVAGGTPFRDAYQHVKKHLDEMAPGDPDEAVALRRQKGGVCEDGVLLRIQERIEPIMVAVRTARGRYRRAVTRLLGVKYHGMGRVDV